VSAGTPRASRNTWTFVPVVNTLTTVPEVGSTSAAGEEVVLFALAVPPGLRDAKKK